MLLRPVECAEFAIDIANVSVVDITIDDVRHDVSTPSVVIRALRQLTPPVRQRAKFLERQTIEPLSVLRGDAHSVPNFLQKRIERWIVNHARKSSDDGRKGQPISRC